MTDNTEKMLAAIESKKTVSCVLNGEPTVLFFTKTLSHDNGVSVFAYSVENNNAINELGEITLPYRGGISSPEHDSFLKEYDFPELLQILQDKDLVSPIDKYHAEGNRKYQLFNLWELLKLCI